MTMYVDLFVQSLRWFVFRFVVGFVVALGWFAAVAIAIAIAIAAFRTTLPASNFKILLKRYCTGCE